jgi:lambda repressor-like predicted transcriptional regulator
MAVMSEYCQNCTRFAKKLRMNGYKELILKFSCFGNGFSKEELWEFISKQSGISRNTFNVTLARMVSKGELIRLERGRYMNSSNKVSFIPIVKENEMKIAEILKNKFPLAIICIYNGLSLSTLQHHLSENNVTYVEVDRCVMESVFNSLKDLGYNVWIEPDSDIIYKYIDLKDNVVIIKPLVTESPLQKINGVYAPTLEKLLVDINKDKDFYYLQGLEAKRMYENANSLYNINPSRLKRYAKRRGLKLLELFIIGIKQKSC